MFRNPFTEEEIATSDFGTYTQDQFFDARDFLVSTADHDAVVLRFGDDRRGAAGGRAGRRGAGPSRSSARTRVARRRHREGLERHVDGALDREVVSRQLARDAAARARLGAAARERVMSHSSWENVAEKVETALRPLAAT